MTWRRCNEKKKKEDTRKGMVLGTLVMVADILSNVRERIKGSGWLKPASRYGATFLNK